MVVQLKISHGLANTIWTTCNVGGNLNLTGVTDWIFNSTKCRYWYYYCTDSFVGDGSGLTGLTVLGVKQ